MTGDAAEEDAGDAEVGADVGARDAGVPRVAVSVNAVIRDGAGRVLVVKPTYKSGWTLPGGQMEADGETPWEACRREVLEECGLDVAGGRLRAVDFRRPRPGHSGGMRVVFDCGVVDEAAVAGIVVQEGEIAEFRFAAADTADGLLRPAVRRRLRAVLATEAVVYLEEGFPVEGVG